MILLDDDDASINESRIDLSQCADRRAIHNFVMEWEPINTAPFDRDLELAVLDAREAHALAFPCRRVLGGWIKANTKGRIDISPTHWRDWKDADIGHPT